MTLAGDNYLPVIMMLVSAVLTALVGVLLKQSNDKMVLRSVLSLSSALILLPFAFILPLPPSEAWPYLIAGVVVHFIYQLTLIGAFQRGDMSIVFPIMRGVAPAFAAVFAFVFLSESLRPVEILGLAIAVSALIGFSWPEKKGARNFSAIGFALICGSMIALYSVVDAAGMRVSRAILEQGFTYIVWFFLMDILALPLFVAWRRRKTLIASFKPELKYGVISGMLSIVGFGLALYAFSIAPIAKMSAIRETSVVFGAIFAVMFLNESFGRRRIILAAILSSGLILMQSA